jgi:hypothetical protein
VVEAELHGGGGFQCDGDGPDDEKRAEVGPITEPGYFGDDVAPVTAPLSQSRECTIRVEQSRESGACEALS